MEKHLIKSTDNEFDYSILDSDTQNKIIEKENTLVGIRSRYAKDVGKVFVEAQEVLANNGNGTFENWFLSLGFKKQNVHNYMNIYKNVQNLDEPEKEVFENLSKSVQIEMSKPSANPKVNEAVYSGDITTHKEYKALEKKLKEKDQQLEEKEKQVNQLHNQILNTPPQRVQTKEVVKEVKPADYDDLKSDNQQLQEILKDKENQFQSLRTQYQDLINQRSEVDEKSKKYDELNEAIKKMQGQLDKGQQEIAAQKEVYDLVRKSKELIAEVAPLTYLIDAENVISNEYAKRPLIEIANKLHDIADKIEKQVENTNIIEGEIVNG